MHLRVILAMVMVAAVAATVRAQTPGTAEPPAEDPRGRELDDLLAKGLRAAEPLTAAETQRAIELALALGRPHGVEPLVKAYFMNDSTPAPALLKLGADNARVGGQFRTAITRQKMYALSVPPGIEASEAAGRLYRLYMDTGLKDEAYAFMKASGEPLRGSTNAKKFDAWLLQMAWERGDLTTVARWLAACLSDQLPLELERLLYWGDLVRLMDVMRIDNPRVYEAVPHARRILVQMRESPGLKARLQFLADSQLFCAGAAARDSESLARDFATSEASAKAWFEAFPTAKTLAAICAMWSNDGDPTTWQRQWERAADAKRAFFKDAFARLPDAEKSALFQQEPLRLVIPSFLPPATWLELIRLTPPSPARNSWAANVPLPWDAKDPALHRAAVPALDGLNDGGAALIRALAAGDDLNSGIDHLVKNESWHLTKADAIETMVDDMIRVCLQFPRDEAHKLPRDAVEQAKARYAREVFFASPLAVLNSGASRGHMKLLWDTRDKAEAVQNFHLLDWVPLSVDERRLVYEDIQKRYLDWSDLVRKAKQNAALKAPETVAKFDAQIALIEPIGQALKAVMDPAVYNPEKAPTPLCKQLAILRNASNGKDRDAALAAARAAYALVRDFEGSKAPFGRMSLGEALRVRAGSGKGVDVSDINFEAFGDQLTLCVETGRRAGLDVALALLCESRKWNEGGLYRAEGADRAKLEAATSKAVLTMLGAGKFDARIFDLYRQTRLPDSPTSREIMSKLIEGKVLVGQPGYSVSSDPRERVTSAATKYQWLIEREFPWMNEKYPRESYFDDMFAEEVTRTRQIDLRFWDRSKDAQRKGANAVCAVLKGYAKVPYGYDGARPAYSPDEFWGVCSYAAARADEASRQELLAAAEAAFGKTRFDDFAVGRVAIQLAGAPVSAEARKALFDRIATMLERVRTLPRNVEMPDLTAAMEALSKSGNLNDAEATLIQRLFTEMRPGAWAADMVGSATELLHSSMLARGRAAELLPAVPCLWAAARGAEPSSRARPYGKLVGRASASADAGLLELAATYSVAGLTLGDQLYGEGRQALETIRSRALVALGGVIPVDRTDRRYPIYAAQLAFLSGLEEEAWTATKAHSELIQSEVKYLEPAYLLWIINKATAKGDLGWADKVARAAIDLLETTGAPMVDNETRARIYVAQADIAAAREDYPLAKSLYERIGLNKNYEGTRARSLAELRVADVERQTHDYSGAVQHLEALIRRDDVFVKATANYLMAQVKIDQVEFKEAKEYLDTAIRLDPGLADARILQGRLFLSEKKLEEATKIRGVSQITSKKVLVPGRSLSIQVEDRNLSVVGRSAGIEVRVWTKAGDEEIMILRPFGDSKTLFEGEISSVLGVAVKADRLLQVLGGDQIFYDFSERFKEVNKVSSAASPPVTVMSDSELYASSGMILSREEMAEIELERQLRSREEQPVKEDKPVEAAALSARRELDQLKPGNSIRVRVVDPGQSVKPAKNTVHVRATTTSGDRVDFEVAESNVCSGVFDGELKTSLAPAAAFASDNNEGSDPAFTISAGDNPPWVGLTDARRPKMLWVDLNDNVAVRSLAVQADVPARKLKRFAVQTSLSGKAFVTVGTWPDPAPAWNGSLQTKVMRFVLPEGFEKAKPAEQTAMIEEALQIGGDPAAPPPVVQPGSLTANLGSQIMGLAAKLGVDPDLKSPESWYVLHLRGAFYQPKRAERAFRANVSGEAKHVLAVDGRAAEADKRTGSVALSGSFGKGVHVLDFYLWAQRGSQVSYAIESDIKEVPYFGTCPADMFDVVKNPQIPVAVQFTPASVVAQPDNNGFDITFATNTAARLIRLVVLDFEGDAPAIKRLKLTAADGRTVLPTKEDLLALRKNDVLECVPGDKIKIIYENLAPLTKERRIQESALSATFFNASLSANFVEFRDNGRGERTPFYVGMRRFRLGDPINVFISDPDCDVSDKADTIKFTARSTSGTTVALEALEVDSGTGRGGGVHSGAFMGKILTVAGQPQRTNELRLALGDDIEITYRDMENTDVGVPWDRTVLVEQAGTDDPELRMYDVVSSLLPPNLRVESGPTNMLQVARDGGHWQWADMPGEFVPARRVIGTTCRDSIDDTSSSTGLVVCPVTVSVTWPAMALSSLSTLRLHAQTGSSRRKANVTDDNAFDPAMPGTITLETGTGGAGVGGGLPPGYKDSVLLRSEAMQAADVGGPLDQGLFTFNIPLQLGETSTVPASTPESRAKDPEAAPRAVTVRPGEDVFIGFEYKSLIAVSNAETGVVSPDTNTHWIVRRVNLLADTQAFDVMDKNYRAPVQSIYMGEKVYLRVVDLPACTKLGEKNTCTVKVQAGDAPPMFMTLNETKPASTVFKGLLQVNAAEDVASSNAPPGVLAAKYGDTVTLTYTGGASNETIERSFRVATGSDGDVQSFTKRFKDPNIAVQTQFSVAEAYFELAKNHRVLKQDELSRREIAQGSKLLQEAIRDFPQTDARAQADYLLAELALELATDTKDEAEKKKLSGDALQRFSEICASYPDSPYAPKAQFKKAVSLEKMGLIDESCQEYVKLAYKYPDHELVAETIARLGKYFLDKGKGMEKEMAAMTDIVKKEKMRLQSVDMYKTAAQVLGRLAKRFPDHSLAAKTSVLSGQCWMRAEDFDRAVVVLRAVIESKRAAPELAAEAMYWCGDAYLKQSVKGKASGVVDAYRMWKKLTWDYPETQWAKYARGRLTEPAVAKVGAADQG